MKTLHVIDSFGMYGAESVIMALMIEQQKLGVSPMLASIGDLQCGEKPIESQAESHGVAVSRFRMRNGPNLMGCMDIIRFARTERIDIIHSHGYKANILMSMIPCKLRPAPVVSTLHGWTSAGRLSRMLLYEWCETRALARLDAIVLVSHAMRSNPHIQSRRLARVFVVPNGLSGWERLTRLKENECDKIDDDIRAFCSSGEFVIGAIGRLAREKGLRELIRAGGILRQKGRMIRILLLGEGYERPALEALVSQLGMEGDVYMPGYRPHASQYLQLLDVLALPSLTEGMPIILLEAMFAGLSVVAAPVGGIPEALQNGKGGILVDSREPYAFAAALERVASEPILRRSMIESSKNHALKNYTSSKMALGYQEVYKACLG